MAIGDCIDFLKYTEIRIIQRINKQNFQLSQNITGELNFLSDCFHTKRNRKWDESDNKIMSVYFKIFIKNFPKIILNQTQH